MKKKIAVFATGWGKEILTQFIKGLEDGFASSSADLFLFVSYPLLYQNENTYRGNINIFELPDLNNFDGAVILGNGFDFPGVFEKICEKAKKAGIPAVSTSRKEDGVYFVGSDNYVGMTQLCEYLIDEQKVDDILYVAGSSQNPDSNIRLEAIKDVLKAHDIPFEDEKDVYYSEWDTYKARDYLREKLEKGEKPRRAYICANDSLALAISDILMTYGHRVPDDCIVTGFDYTDNARLFYPSIASVTQNFTGVGEKCAQILIDHFDGKEVPHENIVECIFKPSESCGYVGSRELDDERKMLGKSVYVNEVSSFELSQKLNNLDAAVLNCRGFAGLSETLCGFYNGFSNFEKGNISILIDPEYEKSIYSDLSVLRKEGYAHNMKVLVSVHDYQVDSLEHFPISKLVPFREERDERNHVYILMPLHLKGYCIGYVVFRDICVELDRNHSLQNYQDRLISIFDKFKQSFELEHLNQQLVALNETDSLTKAKNRKAYDNKMNQINDSILLGEKPEFAICMFDVNNLKTINDALGHEAGDEYIINSSKLICHIYKHSPVYRIGGDEFLVFLQGDDYENRDRLLENIREYMKNVDNPSVPMTERISIASGMAVYDPEKDFDLSGVTRRADGKMYENKTSMKQK